jgi:hypothetical protein
MYQEPPETEWIFSIDGIPTSIGVCVDSPSKPNRITLDVPTEIRIVIAGHVYKSLSSLSKYWPGKCGLRPIAHQDYALYDVRIHSSEALYQASATTYRSLSTPSII